MKNLNHIFLVFFLAFQSINAQFPANEQYQSITPPTTHTLPDYGASIVDTSVTTPIKITRITEAYNYIDSNGDPQVWYPTHSYSKTQVWNADQTLYKISAWKVFNASTYEDVQELASMYPSYWSNTNPDLIWSFRENGDIKKHTISTNNTEIVANIPGYEIIKLGPGEGNIDKNDHYVALVGKKDNGAGSFNLDVIVYDLVNLQIITTKTFPLGWDDGADYAPKYIDWVSISQSGDYVVIMWNHNTTSEDIPYIENGNNHYGVEVFNTTDMQYQRRIINYGNHGDLGYAQDGDEVLVQFYGQYGGGTIYMYKLNGGGSTVLNSHSDFGVSGHISCRNINRPGWAYVTESELDESGQIVAVKLDDSGIVESFGHHFSSALSYAQAAMAVASPKGDKVCFKSDFGTNPVLYSDVAYSFIAEVENTASVNELTDTLISIYPNPASDIITINSNEQIENISIFNQLGQQIKTTSSTNINIEYLSKGMYFFQIKTAKGVSTKKIIVE